MNLWLIVPVKPFEQGKSRLATLLSPLEREQLSRYLLEQTLAVAQSVEELAGVLVVSRAPLVQNLSGQPGVLVLAEESAAEVEVNADALLNRALRQAQEAAVARGADAILVLPADLPLLTADEIRRFCETGKTLARGIVIAASEDGGTNGLLLSPPHAIDFAYGPQSYDRHIHLARQAGLPVQIIHSPALALDLDLPQDVARWKERRKNDA